MTFFGVQMCSDSSFHFPHGDPMTPPQLPRNAPVSTYYANRGHYRLPSKFQAKKVTSLRTYSNSASCAKRFCTSLGEIVALRFVKLGGRPWKLRPFCMMQIKSTSKSIFQLQLKNVLTWETIEALAGAPLYHLFDCKLEPTCRGLGSAQEAHIPLNISRSSSLLQTLEDPRDNFRLVLVL